MNSRCLVLLGWPEYSSFIRMHQIFDLATFKVFAFALIALF